MKPKGNTVREFEGRSRGGKALRKKKKIGPYGGRGKRPGKGRARGGGMSIPRRLKLIKVVHAVEEDTTPMWAVNIEGGSVSEERDSLTQKG